MTDGPMQYDVILADPPWHYNDCSAPPGEMHGRARGAQEHYPAMTTEQICDLPIRDLAADRCALFMWATWPMLPEAFTVIKAWGFEYKTIAWVWVKFNKSGMGIYVGMGHYTRSNSEPCLLAFKGKPLRVADHSVSSVLMAPVMEHSRKPFEQYDRIDRLYPNSSRLELFARRPCDGWDVWGNEVESTIEILDQ